MSILTDNFLKGDSNRDNIDELMILFDIARKMFSLDMSREFVVSAINLALRYEGAYDLIVMWSEESDPQLKEKIIIDLQEEIDDITSESVLPKRLEKDDYLHFDNLEEIAKNVMEFKRNLKAEIERWGGVSKLAKETGIPQSSLSRFLNSPSLPRRSTLEKIAKAMQLRESILLSNWLAS